MLFLLPLHGYGMGALFRGVRFRGNDSSSSLRPRPRRLHPVPDWVRVNKGPTGTGRIWPVRTEATTATGPRPNRRPERSDDRKRNGPRHRPPRHHTAPPDRIVLFYSLRDTPPAHQRVARSLVRSIAPSIARSLDRSLGRSIARSLDRLVARLLDRLVARSLA